MNFEGWSWTAYGLGVFTALAPSVLGFFWFLWRAPMMDDDGKIVSDERATKEKPEANKADLKQAS